MDKEELNERIAQEELRLSQDASVKEVHRITGERRGFLEED